MKPFLVFTLFLFATLFLFTFLQVYLWSSLTRSRTLIVKVFPTEKRPDFILLLQEVHLPFIHVSIVSLLLPQVSVLFPTVPVPTALFWFHSYTKLVRLTVSSVCFEQQIEIQETKPCFCLHLLPSSLRSLPRALQAVQEYPRHKDRPGSLPRTLQAVLEVLSA